MLETYNGTFVCPRTKRSVLLRGVNLSGSSKAPLGRWSHIDEDWWGRAEKGESFVGRPLNTVDGDGEDEEMKEVDEHLRRLRGWGFNCLRYPVTWEALEGKGVGQYDYKFMEYTVRILRRCHHWGFKVYMDPHQDTWSRHTGGSGAPFWTLPLCGIDPTNLSVTHASVLHHEWRDAKNSDEEPHPENFPSMIWSTNYGRLACWTLFTFFFAGKVYAPLCVIDGKNIQDWLQDRFCEANGQLSDYIATHAPELIDECIIGWDGMNEPAEGLVSWEDITVLPTKQGSTLKKGTAPTPAQAMRLGMGIMETLENWKFGTFGPQKDGTIDVDPAGLKIWADPSTEPDGVHPEWGWKRADSWKLGICPWAQHGIWDVDSGYILRKDYFKDIPDPEPVIVDDEQDTTPHLKPIQIPQVDGSNASTPRPNGDVALPSSGPPSPGSDSSSSSSSIKAKAEGEMVAQKIPSPTFLSTFWTPFFVKLAKRVRKSMPNTILFIQPPVFAPPPENIPAEILNGRACYAPHYYDGLTLITKHWNWFNADALGVLRGKYSSPLAAVKIGEGTIRKSLREQMAMLKGDTDILKHLGDFPVLIGEIGIPFDMDNKRSYYDRNNKGDYSKQERALDASLSGCDGENWLNWTVWTYCPDSTHEWGDGWNGEDLSLWSPDDLKRAEKKALMGGIANAKGSKSRGPSRVQSTNTLPTLNSTAPNSEITLVEARSQAMKLSMQNPFNFLTNGARAPRAFCRPWPTQVVGKIKSIDFDIGKAEAVIVITVKVGDRLKNYEEKDERRATEIFVPVVHYAKDQLLPSSAGQLSQQRQGETTTKANPGNIADSTPANSSDTLKVVSTGSSSSTPNASTTSVQSSSTSGNSSTQSGSASPKMKSDWWTALPENGSDILDVEVTVSEGSWSVEGQCLRWWYDVPQVQSRVETPALTPAASPNASPASSPIIQQSSPRFTARPGLKTMVSNSSAARTGSSPNVYRLKRTGSNASLDRLKRISSASLTSLASSLSGKSNRRSPSTVNEEEVVGESGEKEVRIEIRRKGGPIKVEDIERRAAGWGLMEKD